MLRLLESAPGGCFLHLSSPGDLQLRDYVETNPEGPAFSIGGAFEVTIAITRHDIDKIVADKPFFMIATSVHGGWVNSKELEIASAEELDKNKQFMFGRDENGELIHFIPEQKLASTR